ncbi:MAG: hypothetical protein AAGK17_02500 [Pseudomonadota bacterium]
MTESLREAIEKASTTQKALVAVTAENEAFDQRKLIKLRSQYQHDMLAISRLLREDNGLRAEPMRFNEFKARLKTTQDELSQHQAKWLIREIENDRSGYERATRALRSSQEAFFKWAIELI